MSSTIWMDARLGIEVRSAVPEDKEPLMSFIRKVWGGHDYIPYVWDDWLREKDSRMFVVVVDGTPVGMNKVRFLEDGSAWFEGVRVHPDYRGRGLATALGMRSMEEARRRGVNVFRLTSSSWNHQAHRQIARIGFAESSRVSVYSPTSKMRSRKNLSVRLAGPRDFDLVRSTVANSKEFALGSGVMWDTFAAISLSEAVIGRALSDGQVYVSNGSLAIARRGREGGQEWSQVCFLTGMPRASMDLVRHIVASNRDVDRSFVFLPHGSELIGALRRTGMEREFSLILFERRAANG